MREIKFRAWHPEKKQMFSPEEMGADQLTLLPDGRGFINVSSVDTRLSQLVPMIPMQYTGLKDKNGKEIYEGDVVRGIELGYENTGWENELRTGAVVFSKSGSWVYTVGSQEHQLLCYMKNPEILGNIYEHPELISPAG